MLIVKQDEALPDVLGACRGDFGLEGHAVEGTVIDAEGELIFRIKVAQRNLPFDFAAFDIADLDINRKQTRICELFPIVNE